MCFQCNISLLLGRMEARRRAGGSGPTALVGGGPAAWRQRAHNWERAVARRAVLQQRLVVVPEIQQVDEPHGVEHPEEEAADVPQLQEEVEQLLREHQL